MTNFMKGSRLTILGLGLVSRSLINLLLSEKAYTIDDIRVVDKDAEAFSCYSSLGGKKENFINLSMDSKNYHEIFTGMKKGDYLIRLANGCDDKILVKECMERGIHYICTSEDEFPDAPVESFSYRTSFYRVKEIIEQSGGLATSVLQFGVNPGLVSVLTKKALIDIVENDDGDFVTQNRDRLKQLIKTGDFPLLAKELKVTAFVEPDLDSTQADIAEDENTLYNTWNIIDFIEEMNDRSIVKLGSLVSLEECLKKLGISPDKVYYYNRHDGTLVFDAAGKDLPFEAYSGAEKFTGFLDSHEELFSIYDYYTIRDREGEIDYAPSVIFVYRPCELAISSVRRSDAALLHTDTYQFMPITNDRMISGTEAVGVTVEGERFTPVYVGVAPKYDKDAFETPSVLEVSATVYAAMRYISKHPLEGVLYPEYLDVDEILSYTERFLPVTSKRLG